jgi:hypothetical protein
MLNNRDMTYWSAMRGEAAIFHRISAIAVTPHSPIRPKATSPVGGPAPVRAETAAPLKRSAETARQ